MKASRYSLKLARRTSAPRAQQYAAHDRKGQIIGDNWLTRREHQVAGYKNFTRLKRTDEL